MTTTSARKAASEAQLKSMGVLVHDELPEIEADNEVTIRTPQETASRVLCLAAVSSIALGDKSSVIRTFVDRAGVEHALSPEERALLKKSKIAKKEKIKFSWRTEAMVPLLWALKRLPALERTAKQSNLDVVFGALPNIHDDLTGFVRKAKLRPKAELIDMADWVYRAHWAVRHTSLKGVAAAGPLDGGVVMEWHQALNWLIRYTDEDNWDEVSTDT